MMVVHLPVRVTQALRLLACSTVMAVAALISVSGYAAVSGQPAHSDVAIGQVPALRLKQRTNILRWSGLPDLSTQMHQSVVALKKRPDQQQRLLLALLPWSHASLTQPLDQHLRQYDDETLLRLHDALAHPILQRGRDAERAALEDQQAGTSYWQYRQRLLKHPPNIRRMSRIDALLAASHTQAWLDLAQSAFQQVVAVRSDEIKHDDEHDDGQSRELLSWSDEARLFLLYAYRGISNAELDAMLAAWQEPVLQGWLSDASARLPGPG
jgi:hypothetical protein